MDERVLLRARIDDLLDALVKAYADRDLAQEKCAYMEHALGDCMEREGLVL